MPKAKSVTGPLELYMHTPKAVKRGHPDSRVFLVTGKEDDYKIAWKCELRPDGLWHPGYLTKLFPITRDGVLRARVHDTQDGSAPTAVFKPDSLYVKVTIAELKRRAKALANDKVLTALRAETKAAEANLTKARAEVKKAVAHLKSIKTRERSARIKAVI